MTDTRWREFPALLDAGERRLVMEAAAAMPEVAAATGEDNNHRDPRIRQSIIRWLPRDDPTFDWLFARMDATVEAANAAEWQFDYMREGNPNFQYSEYRDAGSHYAGHQDTFWDGADLQRKLSFTLLLVPALAGGQLYIERTPLALTPGDAVVFPSTLWHTVAPVTVGARISVVGWYDGPRWR
ncbi:MAG: 2OG-Fe(II) oxygenase [Alphaproteobacteria bacterium]|nr:2OG-Fe(II) oxygenase [Alphaproteobacteria bacterium]